MAADLSHKQFILTKVFPQLPQLGFMACHAMEGGEVKRKEKLFLWCGKNEVHFDDGEREVGTIKSGKACFSPLFFIIKRPEMSMSNPNACLTLRKNAFFLFVNCDLSVRMTIGKADLKLCESLGSQKSLKKSEAVLLNCHVDLGPPSLTRVSVSHTVLQLIC